MSSAKVIQVLAGAAVAACGVAERERHMVEAFQACSRAEAFGMYLDLVVGIRAPGTGA